MIPKYNKTLRPIMIGERAMNRTRIANSGEDGGFSYTIHKKIKLFYSLYDFPISEDLASLLSKYGNVLLYCDYEEWLPWGDEDRFDYDMDITSRMCIFLNAYFNLVYPYYNYEFIPGDFCTSRDGWKEHGPIRYCYDME